MLNGRTKPNIVEMRETLSENPYWTKSYNAYGRTVDVNIPIMIPDVDALPIMTVIPHMLFEEETSCKIEIENAYTGTVNEADLYSASVYDSVHIRMNTPSDLLTSHPKDYLKYERSCYYPWEIEGKEQTVFAESNPLSLSDAEHIIKGIVDNLYVKNEGYALEYVEIRSRARKAKSDIDFVLGDTVDYYPYGSYYFVNAVTGEVFDRRMPSWNSLYSPQ